MTPLTELALALLDLLKVKLEQARVSAFDLILGAWLILTAALLFTGGLGLMIFGFRMAMLGVMPAWGANLLTGGLALVIAGVLMWAGKTKIEG